MPNLAAIARSFPDRELLIRRLALQDPDFRAVCDDHKTCVAALRHWEAQGDDAGSKAGEYRQLLAEVEAEIAAYLARHQKIGRPTPPADGQGPDR